MIRTFDTRAIRHIYFTTTFIFAFLPLPVVTVIVTLPAFLAVSLPVFLLTATTFVVNRAMQAASSRAAYCEVIRQLERMKGTDEGRKIIADLAEQWRRDYSQTMASK